MRSFKKIAAMTLAVAMLCSFTALGAEVALTDINDITDGTTSVTINYTSSASQSTVLLYAGTSLSGANVVYIDQLLKDAQTGGINVDLANAPANTDYTVMVGGADVATADTDTFYYGIPTVEYNVTLTAGENGTASADKDLSVAIEKDEVVNFTFVPNLGYELTAVEVNGVSQSVTGNTFALTVTEDTTVQPVFTADADLATADSYTYNKVFDLAAEHDEGLSQTGENFASKLFFGSALAGEKTITSMGMYVKKDGAEFTTEEGVGPYFAAAPHKITGDNKYGIRFYAFAAGSYEVRAYAKYDDGTTAFGDIIEFTVD